MDIDTSGFELGMPTRFEMLEHQSHMLCNENDALRLELARAQHNITKLVEINQALQEQIAVEHRRANCAYVEYVHLMNTARCTHGINLADHRFAADPVEQVNRILASTK
ncbi:hypothetical protein KSS94_08900 [Pseudomonas fakonensis]|uniref:Uncharacterized protein n=1 Tax=Pseudomonas fakonensis TaxID=2842355 RepID=A0ABX8NBG9_9PSED|nr:hypothetical protein [Pseudomonas fakonensis]QXH53215.1 hypothetical protein KSS94_08900 [Pseudomonas fakonensis]